jgi:hypothetical protein
MSGKQTCIWRAYDAAAGNTRPRVFGFHDPQDVLFPGNSDYANKVSTFQLRGGECIPCCPPAFTWEEVGTESGAFVYGYWWERNCGLYDTSWKCYNDPRALKPYCYWREGSLGYRGMITGVSSSGSGALINSLFSDDEDPDDASACLVDMSVLSDQVRIAEYKSVLNRIDLLSDDGEFFYFFLFM